VLPFSRGPGEQRFERYAWSIEARAVFHPIRVTPRPAERLIIGAEMILGRTLKAFGVMAAAFIAGGILWGLGHWLIGLILVCAAIPVGFTVWIIDDRD